MLLNVPCINRITNVNVSLVRGNRDVSFKKKLFNKMHLIFSLNNDKHTVLRKCRAYYFNSVSDRGPSKKTGPPIAQLLVGSGELG